MDSIKDRFQEDGYALVQQCIPDALFQPIVTKLNDAVEDLARKLFQSGEISDPGSSLDFENRLAGLDPTGKIKIPTGWNHLRKCKELFDLAVFPDVVEILEKLVGSEIYYTWSTQIRSKLPERFKTDRVRKFPWHQDSQYYNTLTDVPTHRVHITTLWIPLVDVTEANGCLWVIPGSHKWGIIKGERDELGNMRSAINVEDRGTPRAIHMKKGDVLFFSGLCYHSSKLNLTDTARWSIDHRYIATSVPGTDPEEKAFARRYVQDLGEQRKQEPAFPVKSINSSAVPASWEDYIKRFPVENA